MIERTPDGQVIHAWRPIDDVNLAAYTYVANPHELQGRLVQVVFNRHCEEERDACETMCLSSLRGRAWSHMTRGSKDEHCRAKCRPAYLDCCRLKELAEGTSVKFHAVDEAVDWLKQNREKVRVGAVVVITGVAFVVVVGGSGGGALLLVPALLLTSADVATGARTVAVHP